MTKHFEREIEHIKKRILILGALVEDRLFKAVKALTERSMPLAQEVCDADNEVDDIEVEIEEECLKLLALYQPVAADLRFIIAVLKINNDLERIGDLAVNIAHRGRALSGLVPIEMPFPFADMSSKVKLMVRKSLEALVTLDSTIAQTVCKSDIEIDTIYQNTFIKVEAEIQKNPAHTKQYLHMVTLARHLERVGDHATNIAEDVIYMIEGQIVRHGRG